MVKQTRIPHEIFKHILSYKDPTRQVGIKGGIKTDSARAWPINVADEMKRLNKWGDSREYMIEGQLYYDRDPPIEQYHCFNSFEWEITIWKSEQLNSCGYFDGQLGGWGKRINSFSKIKETPNYSDLVAKCPDTIAEMSMQREACGDEELFVHNYKKHMSGSNK